MNMTKGTLPRVPFLELKRAALGKNYELSLVFIGNTRSRRLNKTYRDKPYPTNILSFPISKTSGEIFINIPLVKKEAKKFNRTFPNFVGFLFIHGLFHLIGMEHGARMESAEKKLRNKFNI